MIKKWLSDREVRKYLYGVSLTVIPLLVAYGAIEKDSAALWIALVGSILAPTVALTHLTPKDK